MIHRNKQVFSQQSVLTQRTTYGQNRRHAHRLLQANAREMIAASLEVHTARHTTPQTVLCSPCSIGTRYREACICAAPMAMHASLAPGPKMVCMRCRMSCFRGLGARCKPSIKSLGWRSAVAAWLSKTQNPASAAFFTSLLAFHRAIERRQYAFGTPCSCQRHAISDKCPPSS